MILTIMLVLLVDILAIFVNALLKMALRQTEKGFYFASMLIRKNKTYTPNATTVKIPVNFQ
jgi:hypothetical protein